MNTLSVSVIVSTWNRAEVLKVGLMSLIQQDFDGDYEIIVMDNNSTDDTPSVVRTIMKGSRVPLRYVVEKNQGLSFARNRGISESQGDIVAFIDDDARAAPSWIHNIFVAFHGRRNVGAVGGRILLDWPDVPPPLWLTKELYPSLGFFDPGSSEAIEVSDIDLYPHGSNMSFFKPAIAGANLFDVTTGRRWNSFLAGEEIGACRTLQQQGWKIVYTPHAVVYHKVLPHRMTKKYFLDFYRGQGTTFAVVDKNCGHYFLERMGRYILRLIKSILLFLKNLRKEDGRFFAYLNIISSCASLRALFRPKEEDMRLT